MLSRFLSDAFPELTNRPYDDPCWIAKAIQSDDPRLSILSTALQVVEDSNQSALLTLKLNREHPSDREHDPQFDARVRDCLTEACAFAWASMRGIGTPIFYDSEGAPDILLDTGRWIEVKAIHHSREEAVRMEKMLSGEILSGLVAPPSPGLFFKFDSSLLDAKKKFDRQESQVRSTANIVFFNLTTIDTPQMPKTEEVLEGLMKWSEMKEEAIPDVTIVMCYGYNWKISFRDPFNQ